MSHAVVVGMGVVTPLAADLDGTWQGLLDGRVAIGPIRRFDASRYPVRFAAEGPDLGVGRETPAISRAWLSRALGEALQTVDLREVPATRIGVFVGSEADRPSLEALSATLEGHPPVREHLTAHAPWAPTRWLCERLGARGPAATLSTACTSSGQAVGEGLLAVRRGEVDVAVVAGVDVLVHPLMVTGFSRLGALSTRNEDPARASRPFDMDRDGFVLGEGAGVMILAAPHLAATLGPSLGRVTGYGCTSNAWRITDSPPDGRGAAQAMRLAMEMAGLSPDRVGWVHAHGTSTRQNDLSEAAAVHGALGEAARTVPVSSTKSTMGHLVAACGVVNSAIAVRAVSERRVPPAVNLDKPDPACDLLHPVGGPRPMDHGSALVNAFGFGGVNASVVVEAP